jgi:cytochrome c2
MTSCCNVSMNSRYGDLKGRSGVRPVPSRVFRTVLHRIAMTILTLPCALSLLAQPLSAGDTERGKKVFRKCAACHAVGSKAKNRVGPKLNGIVGRKAGTVKGFKYSKANTKAGEDGLVWTEDVLLEYLENPRAAMPGTKMVFAGLKKQKDREDLVAYLVTIAADGASAMDTVTTSAKKADNGRGRQEDKQETKTGSRPAAEAKNVMTKAATDASVKPSAKKSETSAVDAEAKKSDDAATGVSPPESWVAGEAPSVRPPWAPMLKEFKKDEAWYEKALSGLSEPYPPSFRFLEDQGGWHTPFNHPGMTGPHDLRNWHAK